jgi:hypothetical protein
MGDFLVKSAPLFLLFTKLGPHMASKPQLYSLSHHSTQLGIKIQQLYVNLITVSFNSEYLHDWPNLFCVFKCHNYDHYIMQKMEFLKYN